MHIRNNLIKLIVAMFDHVVDLLCHAQNLLSNFFHIILEILGDDLVSELLVGIVWSVCLGWIVE